MQESSTFHSPSKMRSDPSSEEFLDKFQAFLRQIKEISTEKTEQNFHSTIENLKNPSYKIKNPQDFNEINSLYLTVSPLEKRYE